MAAFGQKASLVNTLKDILNNYPENSIIKEMIQNADDAGAREVKVVYCDREWGETGTEDDKGFRGPALYIYNDETFTPEDLESIQNVGGSCKKDNLQKTGRFGIGFNSVYHVSELPSLLTGTSICYFDPSCKHLPPLGGKHIDFSTNSGKETLKKHASHFSPLTIMGWDPASAKAFNGTLFRLPLRTVKHAETSPLRSTPCTPSGVKEILSSFKKEASRTLFFLKSVVSVEICKYATGTGLVLDYKVCLEGATGTDLAQRAFQKRLPVEKDRVARLAKLLKTPVSSQLALTICEHNTNGKESEQKWLVCQSTGFKEGKACRASCDELAEIYKRKLLPWGGVAVCLDAPIHPDEGKAYCFLPLPESTSLPFHCNGYFEVPSNRGNICWGTDESGEAKFKSNWNETLLTDAIPHGYLSCVTWVLKHAPEMFYQLVPTVHTRMPWKLLSNVIFEELKKLPCIDCGPHGWVKPHECLYAEEGEDIEVIEAIRKAGITVGTTPERVVTSLGLKDQLLSVENICERLASCDLTLPGVWGPRSACIVLGWVLSKLSSAVPQPASALAKLVRSVPFATMYSGNVAPFDNESHVLFTSEIAVIDLVKGTKAVSMVVDWDLLETYPQLASRFSSPEFRKLLNVYHVNSAADVFNFLPLVLAQCKDSPTPMKPSQEVVEKADQFWSAVGVFDKTLSVPATLPNPESWCVLPCREGFLCPLSSSVPILLSSTSLPESLLHIFSAANIHLTNLDVPLYVSRATPCGVLRALHAKRDFLVPDFSDTLLAWLRGVRKHIPDDVGLLADLPIWKTYGSPPTSPPGVVKNSFELLPEKFIETPICNMISGDYICVDKDLHTVLCEAGVPVALTGEVWKTQFLDKCEGLAQKHSKEAFLRVVVQLVHSDLDRDPTLRNLVQTMPIFPTQVLLKGDGDDSDPITVYKPLVGLFDPRAHRVAPFLLLSRVLDLEALMVYSKGVALQLTGLGLRNSLDRSAVLQLATDLQDASEANFDKSEKLLKYLNDNIDDFSDRYKGGFFGALKKLTSSTREEDEFFKQLGDIAWFPSLQTHSSGCVVPRGQLLKSSEVRLLKDFWLCSYHMGVLPISVDNIMVHDLFKWGNSVVPPDVLAKQLLSLADNESAVSRSVDEIYSALHDRYSKTGSLDGAREVLMEKDFIWVEGHGMVSAERVAIKAPIHGLPGLYQLEGRFKKYAEIFKECGMRDEFKPASYAKGLEQLKKKHGMDPLNSEELRTVTSVLIGVPDLRKHDIYVPDSAGVLRTPNELLFNEMPWEQFIPNEGLFIVHENLSMEIANKLGVGSRRATVCEGDLAEYGHAYGQSESITDRIKSILDQYVDDVGIINEVVQNADDSGATEFVVMLDKASYNRERLLDPKMAAWQGPAVVMYNNKPFTEKDFANLSEIGKGSKINDVAKTGKFGLGFNAVYQFTDVPSFVSGEYLVLLDPHRKYLTQFTKANAPGFRVKIPSKTVTGSIFEDQFKPYAFKGHLSCGLDKPYDGTLFRFPLRTGDTAAASSIKSTSYSIEQVEELLHTFCATAEDLLLFLKHIGSIKVVVREEDGTEQLLFSMKKETTHGRDQELKLYNFVAGEPGVSDSKDDFKKRLASTVDNNLPKALTKCTVIREILKGGSMERFVDEWLVSNVIGRGAARQMALDAEEGQRLVPWAGAALLRKRNKIFTPVKGKAFSVLPLPATAGALNLAFHVNGAFELSSNRRNLWADDHHKTGDKTSWNLAVIQHACVPAVLCLIQHLQSDTDFPMDRYYSLLPAKLEGKLWGGFMEAFYNASDKVPLLYSNGKWITRKEAVFANEKTPPKIKQLLLDIDCHLVDINTELLESMGVTECIDNNLVRKLLRSTSLEGVTDEGLLVAALKYCQEDLGTHDKTFDELVGLPLLKLLNGEFAKFGSCDDTPIYINFSRDVFTPLRDRFADSVYFSKAGLVGNPSHDHDRLKALEPHTNVKRYDQNDFEEMFPVMFPELSGMQVVDRRNPAAPSKGWLDVFWKDFAAQGLKWEGEICSFPLIPATTRLVSYNEKARVSQSRIEGFFTAFEIESLDRTFIMEVKHLLEVTTFSSIAKALHRTHGDKLPNVTNGVEPGVKTSLLNFMELSFKNKNQPAIEELVKDVFKQLPIFPVAGSDDCIAIDDKHFVANPDVPPEVLTKDFYCVTTGVDHITTRDNRTSFLVKLGATCIPYDEFILSYLIPSLSDTTLDESFHTAADGFLIDILKTATGPVFEGLTKLPWVRTKVGTCKPVFELVDPGCTAKEGFGVPKAMLPHDKYRTELKNLRKLGLQVSLNTNSISKVAKTITDTKEAEGLLKYVWSVRDTNEQQKILMELQNETCVGVCREQPHPGLPWNPELVPENGLMKPNMTRPVKDMYLCSYSCGLVDLKGKDGLVNDIWYEEAIRDELLVKQLEMCGKHNAPYEVVKHVYAELSKRLRDPVTREALQPHLAALRHMSTIYVGSGLSHDYTIPGNASLVLCDIDARPMLWDIPSQYLGEWVDSLIPLRVALGVKKYFTAQDYAPLLTLLADERETEPVTERELTMCCEIAVFVSESPEKNIITHLPDAEGVLRTLNKLVYDREATTATTHEYYISVHPRIPHNVASLLGVQSVEEISNHKTRYVMKNTVDMDEVLKYLRRNPKPSVKCLMRDFLEFAHKKQCNVSFTYDSKVYTGGIPGTQDYQKEALVVHLDVQLTSEVLLKLFKRTWGGVQGGFGSCFAIADCVQVMTSDELLFYQPLKESIWYSIGDVLKNFRGHLNQLLEYKNHGTTLRIPIRASKSAFDDPIQGETVKICLRSMSTSVPAMLAFTCVSKVVCQEHTADGYCNTMRAEVKPKPKTDERKAMWNHIPQKESMFGFMTKSVESTKEFIISVEVVEERQGSEEGPRVDIYKWGVCMMSGCDESRRLGVELSRAPLGGVAALLQYNSEKPRHEWLKMTSRHMKPIPHNDDADGPGIPVQIFTNNIPGNPKWNTAIMSNVWGAYTKLLHVLPTLFAHELPSQEYCYEYWPSPSVDCKHSAAVMEIYAKISSTDKLFLYKNSLATYNHKGVRFVTGDATNEVISIVSKELNAFTVPSYVGQSMVAKKTGKAQALPPADVRQLCHAAPSFCVVGKLSEPSHIVQLLSLSITDLEPPHSTKLRGICLLPLETPDGKLSVERFGDRRVFLGDTDAKKVLRGIPGPELAFVHPEVSKTPSVFKKLSSPEFGNAIQIYTPDMEQITNHMHAVYARGCNEAPVKWKGMSEVPTDEVGEVSKEWLNGFWKLLAGEGPNAVKHVEGWPLLPLEDGRLVDCGLVSDAFMFKPEGDGSEHTTTPDAAPAPPPAAEPQQPAPALSLFTGFSALIQGGIDIMNRALNTPDSSHNYDHDPNDARDVLTALRVPVLDSGFVGGTKFQPQGSQPQVVATKLASLTEKKQLQWDTVEQETREATLSYFSQHAGDFRIARHSKQLRSLPLFSAIGQDGYTSIENEGVYATKPGNPFFTPERGWIANHEQELLAALGVVTKTETDVWRYHILPAFEETDFETRYNQLEHIREHMETSYADDESFAAFLKDAKLFPNSEDRLHRASDFLHPSLTLVQDVFGDERLLLPHGRYSEGEWLPFLETLGMRNEVTAEIFIRCAKRIDQEKSSPEIPERIYSGARALLVQLKRDWDAFVDTPTFTDTIAKLHIVPAYKPGTETMQLFRFEQCCQPAYRHLVPFSMPMLKAEWMPPKPSAVNLRAPRISNIVKSLQAMDLKTYPLESDPAEDFSRVLDYISQDSVVSDPSWKTFRTEIGKTPCVPVAMMLGCPDCMFKSIDKPMPPFAIQIPEMYQKQFSTLEMLGSRQTFDPSQDTERVILQIGKRREGTYLNPTELNSYLKMMVAGKNHRVTHVPDQSCVLRKKDDVVYNDAPWMLESIRSEGISFANDRLTRSVCKALQLKMISQTVRHTIDDDEHMKNGKVMEDLTRRLTSETFAGCLRDVYNMQDRMLDVRSITAKLSKCSVVSVTVLTTRFHHNTRNVTEVNNKSLYFIDKPVKSSGSQSTTIYVRAVLPEYITHTAILAQCITDILNTPPAPYINDLLASEPENMQLVLTSLHAATVSVTEAGSRGILGKPILASEVFSTIPDPSYTIGECVAYKGDADTGFKYGEIRQITPVDEPEVKFQFLVDIGLGRIKEKFPFEVKKFDHDGRVVEVDETGETSDVQNRESEDKEDDIKGGLLRNLLTRLEVDIGEDRIDLLSKLERSTSELATVRLDRDNLRELLQTTQDDNTCSICFNPDVPRNTCLVPCGHVLCQPCSACVQRCPMCSSTIQSRQTLYM
eukprot:TRINITY_DN4657_c1_g1_i1.p1 TRINITY_DN4657_c1_g1~~TRINITY_DN4657_c1_g1_i1.p1  ORF type:complete len:4321 (+),score=807.67 TRINITY_DN4657_c1_g1_i1:90-12965(+)